jgi:RNA polymerase sigma-70 factor (ECF subfamily)
VIPTCPEGADFFDMTGDQLCPVRGHFKKNVSGKSIARLALPARAMARPLAIVPDWKVSSERALRPLTSTDDGANDDSIGQIRQLEFDEIFRRFAPYVGAVVLRLIGRPGDVDDVVQDVFIQAHRGLPRLRDKDAVRPWLRRIAVRRAQRWLRTRWVRRWFGDSDFDAETDLVDATANPEERAQIAHVYRTLERMNKDERLAWVLRFVEGETLEQIAELLGCSVSTVQRRLRSADQVMGQMR